MRLARYLPEGASTAKIILHHPARLGKLAPKNFVAQTCKTSSPRESLRTLAEEPLMPEFSPSARIVLTTAANIDEARNLARTLVEEHLAACATLIPAVESIYRWKGQLESSSETMLLLKTGAEQLPALENRLHALHTYETPEFLVLPVEAGSPGYLQWMFAALAAPADDSPPAKKTEAGSVNG